MDNDVICEIFIIDIRNRGRFKELLKRALKKATNKAKTLGWRKLVWSIDYFPAYISAFEFSTPAPIPRNIDEALDESSSYNTDCATEVTICVENPDDDRNAGVNWEGWTLIDVNQYSSSASKPSSLPPRSS